MSRRRDRRRDARGGHGLTRAVRAGAPRWRATLSGLVLAAALPAGALAQTPVRRPAPTAPRTRPTARDTTVRDTTVRPPSGTATGIGGTGGDTTRTGARAAAIRRDSTTRDSTARTGARADSARADSARADSALVEFAPDDSTITALRARPGYEVVRYQGDTVRFRAERRVLTLRGRPAAPAAVERGSALLVGQTVRYDDSLQVVTAVADSAVQGDSVVLRDPAQGSDVVVRGNISYDLTERRGVVSGFSTNVTQGETWFVSGAKAAFATDSTRSGAPGAGRTFYAHDGSVTSCDEITPHYHFQARDIKFVSKSLLVIRPAVLYVGNVPVLWLPFVFQDTRPGRRSGLLRPTFGIAELIRNSPNYQRSIRNFGYYTTLGDYADVRGWVDWRSGARPGQFGYGVLSLNAESRYKVIDRFIDGNVSVAYDRQTDGRRNTRVSLQHSQSFNQNRGITANINYQQNTQVQRRNQFNPFAVNANTNSAVNFKDRYGPVSLGLGGTATQYAGRPQRDLNFPNLNLTSQTVAVTRWLDWTPTLSVSNAQRFRIDNGVQFPVVYTRRANGTLDSTRVNAASRNTTVRFDTPLKLFNFQWQNAFTFAEDVQDYASTRLVFRDIRDTTTRETRTFAQTFQSNLDWTTSFGLPSFFQGTWNVAPSVSFNNVDQAGLFFRTERSGGRWVRGSKRVSVGVGASPTFYAFAPGIFGAERFRHSITPSIAYSYSPRANVSDDFLRAIGRSRQGYLGQLQQNRVSLTLTTNLEAKLRARPTPVAGATAAAGTGADSAARTGGAGAPARAVAGAVPNATVTPLSGGSANAEGRKVKVLSAQFSSLDYDFTIADSVSKKLISPRGFVNQTFAYTLTTDLIPGLSFRKNYNLFLGDPRSDTASFKPFRDQTSLNFQLDRNSALLGAVGRLFGLRLGGPAGPVASPTQNAPGLVPGGDPAFADRALASRAAGSDNFDSRVTQPPQSFQLSVSYSSSRQRPDLRGQIVAFDPASVCNAAQYAGDPFGLQQCQNQARFNPLQGDTLVNRNAIGAPIFRTPPLRTLQVQSGFHVTQKWTAQWGTTYDLVRKGFASNQVTLARELHDWLANFSYTAAQNGNSAFSFFISLKAQPDLKFPYNRVTTRGFQ